MYAGLQLAGRRGRGGRRLRLTDTAGGVNFDLNSDGAVEQLA
jgi:hypothetical protein